MTYLLNGAKDVFLGHKSALNVVAGDADVMNPLFAASQFQELLEELKQLPFNDSVESWPEKHLLAMSNAGVMTWDIPTDWDGTDLPAADMLEGLRLLASANLTATFVLTQRSAAVRRIATSANHVAKKRLLPGLCSGQLSATVGISHLTTSGQHLKKPLVQATECNNGFELDGFIPWATGATHADHLVTGGTLQNGQQILAVVPGDRQGLQVQTPSSLMALNASQTGAVKLDRVRVSTEEILHGPVESVMKQGSGGGAGSLGTSSLALGVTAGALKGIEQEATKRADLQPFLESLQSEHDQLLSDVRDSSAGNQRGDGISIEEIRQRANSLVLRSAQTWLAATKGAGFVSGHPAEQAVRESMFFLVWSCPQPVLNANLNEFACAFTS